MRSACVLGASLLAAIAGCDRPPVPRLSAIETVYAFSTGPTTRDWIFEYAELDRHVATVDAGDQGLLRFVYRLGRVGEVERYFGGELTSKTSFHYGGGQVRRAERTNADGSLAELTTAQYDGDRMTSLEVLRTGDRSDGEVYEYDQDGQLFKRTARYQTAGVDQGPPWERTLRWQDGRLISSESPAGVLAYAYDEDGRVVSIGDDDTVQYGDNGLIEAVESRGPHGVSVTRYRYIDGDVQGFIPTPDLENGVVFGLDGRPRPAMRMPSMNFFFLQNLVAPF